MKKTIRVVKTFKIVKRSCSLNRYYRVEGLKDYSVLSLKKVVCFKGIKNLKVSFEFWAAS